MKLHCCIVIILQFVLCRAWNGIVIDNGDYSDGTQLILPNSVPHTVGNVTFGLPHCEGAAAVRHPDGNAYFIGGANRFGDQDYFAAVTKFNPATNTSSAAASMNIRRSKHAATVVGNTIIVCGGWTAYGSVRTSSCEQSNANVTSWTNITSLPIALSDLAMVTLLGKAYVIGGTDSGNVTQTSVRMYDGVSVWTAKAAMSPGRAGHAALALDDNRALVCGGVAPAITLYEKLNTCVIYTASTDTWTTAPAMAQARSRYYDGFNLVMSEGLIYAFGGDRGTANTIEMYSTTGGGTLLPYTMVTGGTSTSAAVAIGATYNTTSTTTTTTTTTSRLCADLCDQYMCATFSYNRATNECRYVVGMNLTYPGATHHQRQRQRHRHLII